MLETKPCFWFERNLCLQVVYLSVLFLVWGSYRSLRMVVLELFTFYFCCLAWWLLTAIDTREPLYSEASAEALHLYLLCSLCSVDHLHGNRGAVTWHVSLNIAQHWEKFTISLEIYWFTGLSNQFPPSKFTIKWVCYDSELHRSPCWWHCIDYCILILHVFFSKLSFIFNFLSCCSLFFFSCFVL